VLVRDARELATAETVIRAAVGTDETTTDTYRRLVSAAIGDRMTALSSTIRALEDAGIRAEDVALRRPTLDEVFIHLTGEDNAIDHTQEASR
jgi:ABC-2 type transport system ATP-binding protein